MAEPWEVITDDTREPDRVATYIIFCEDGYHEPAYFKSFEIEKRLKINAFTRQGQSRQNFYNVVKKCREDDLLQGANGVYKVKEGVTENIWCVYDRDENFNQPNTKERDDIDFNTAIKNATDAGLKVAWSNDAFELWVLLHFETVPANVKLCRTNIYALLTEVFRNFANKSNELIHITNIDAFRYEKHLKSQFSPVVLPLLKERTNIALEKSRALEEMFPDNVLFHDRNPCTKVHHLVQELLAFHPPLQQQ